MEIQYPRSLYYVRDDNVSFGHAGGVTVKIRIEARYYDGDADLVRAIN